MVVIMVVVKMVTISMSMNDVNGVDVHRWC